MSIFGVDVSENNGDINWHAVKRAGFDFAIIKVNEGNYIDRCFNRARVDAARSAGLVVGGYDFIRPIKGRTGAQEFDIHFENARRAGLYHTGDIRPVIDVEASTLSPEGTRQYVRSWVRRCQERLHTFHPIIYTGFFWRDSMGNWGDSLGCRLWYPSYPHIVDVPNAWRRPTIHQYSEHGRVPGVPGDCDLDHYLGRSLSQFRAECCLKF